MGKDYLTKSLFQGKSKKLTINNLPISLSRNTVIREAIESLRIAPFSKAVEEQEVVDYG